MKLGKIVEISGFNSEKGFEIIYGIDINEGGKKRYSFCTIIPTGVYMEGTRLTYIYSGYLKEKPNVYIVSTDSDPKQKPDAKLEEEFLWVIIPYSSGIESNAEKIDGSHPTEAILKMCVGETVTVRKAGTTETYMVAKAGNELFLVKKNR